MKKARKTTLFLNVKVLLNAGFALLYLFFYTLFCTLYFALLMSLANSVFAETTQEKAKACIESLCPDVIDFEEELAYQGTIYPLSDHYLIPIRALITNHLKTHLKSGLGLYFQYRKLPRVYEDFLNELTEKYQSIFLKAEEFKIFPSQKLRPFEEIKSSYEFHGPGKKFEGILKDKINLHNDFAKQVGGISYLAKFQYNIKFKIEDFYKDGLLLEELVVFMEESTQKLIQFISSLSNTENFSKLNVQYPKFNEKAQELTSTLFENQDILKNEFTPDYETLLINQTIEKTLRLLRENLYLFSLKEDPETYRNLFLKTKEKVFSYLSTLALAPLLLESIVAELSSIRLVNSYDKERYLTSFTEALKTIARTDKENSQNPKYQESLINIIGLPKHPYDEEYALLTQDLMRLLYSFDYRGSEDKFVKTAKPHLVFLGPDTRALSLDGVEFIFAHEITHGLYTLLKERSKEENEEKNQSNILKVFNCLTQFSSQKADQKTLTEDFADFIGAKVSPVGAMEFACHNVYYNNQEYALDLFDSDPSVHHSTALFRLLHLSILNEELLPLFCTNLLNSEATHLDNCTP